MKKSILSIILVFLLTSCMESAAVLSGPTLALVKTTNDVQSSFALGASYGLKKATGKTIIENVIGLSNDEQKITKIKKNEELIHSFYPNTFYYPDAFPKLKIYTSLLN